jgi:hypothetical protein
MKILFLIAIVAVSYTSVFAQENINLIFLDSLDTEWGAEKIYVDKSKMKVMDSRLLKFTLVIFSVESITKRKDIGNRTGVIDLEDKQGYDYTLSQYTDKIIAIYQSTLKKKKK